MRKRNTAKKKAAKFIKTADVIERHSLDKLFTDVGLIRKEWYTKAVHEATLKTLVEGNKLQAIKNLMDISREKDGDNRYGLKNLKDFVDQFDYNVKHRRIALGLEENTLPFNTGNVIPAGTSDREILTDVIQSISNDVKYRSSTNGLRKLLSHVPMKILKEYWIKIK